MPSYLNDSSLDCHSSEVETEVVHLDSAGPFGLPHEKLTERIPHQQAPLPHPHPSDDSFSTRSSNSTHNSDASELLAQTTGDSSSPPSMNNNTLHNGGPDGGLAEAAAAAAVAAAAASSPAETKGITRSGANDTSRRPLANGNTVTLVDRTASQKKPLANGTTESHGHPAQAPPRTSQSSMNGSSVQPSPSADAQQVASKDKDVAQSSESTSTLRAPLSNGTARGLTATSLTSLPPERPSFDTAQSSPNTQRFSSPPYYNNAAGPSTSASGSLQPPPPSGGIKHRHTLEVPKVSSGRSSRDSADNAFTTGRFSPTSASLPGGVRRPSLNLGRRNTRSLQSDGAAREEIALDDDAMRWAEAYRAKRASKRKRREVEDDDRVLVGIKVDETHTNWVTAYNMLTGIRVSVSRTNAKLDRSLTDADFQAKQKSTFDIAGNELVPSAKYDFKFKDYAPWVFRHLRQLFRLDPADYLMSLTGKYILSELGSPGKSGSFFYFSRDYKYIIKTIHHSEHKFLRRILKDYYQHVTDNPNTLLSQFYGLHRVKMPYGKKIHFVIMNNLFPPHRDIHQTFDLKGSTIGRDYREDDLATNPRATLKDLNWLRRQRHLELGIQKKQLFLQQLHKDVRLLQRLQIMDYSLLIGIHDLQKGNEENLRDKTLKVFNPGGDGAAEEVDPNSVLLRTPSKLENQRKARELRQMIKAEGPVPLGETLPNELDTGQGHRTGFVFNEDDGGFRATHEDNLPGEEIYYLGVIDCLTHYGIIKKIEHFWKGLSNDKTQISALPPQEYGERFLNFIEGVTMSQEEAHRLAQERDAAMQAEAVTHERERERERVSSWGSRRRGSVSRIPPIPEYQPPPPPNVPSPHKSPEIDATMQRAEHQARKTESRGATEEAVPDRVLKTAVRPGLASQSSHASERDSKTTVLPIVEEAAEGSTPTAGSRSRASQSSTVGVSLEGRPQTPSYDGVGRQASVGSNGGRGPPPTPPKPFGLAGYGSTTTTANAKPDSADSGYGVGASSSADASTVKSATGSQRSMQKRTLLSHFSRDSRDSLDKALPPLPSGGRKVEAVPSRTVS